MSEQWHNEGWIWKGQVYCDNCLPEEVNQYVKLPYDRKYCTTPIIPHSKWSTPLRCTTCRKGLNITLTTKVPKFTLQRDTHVCNTSLLSYGIILRWLHGPYPDASLYRVKRSDGAVVIWHVEDIVVLTAKE